MTRFKNALILAWWAFRYALITLRHKWYVVHGYHKAGVPWWLWRSIWHDLSKFGPAEIFAYGFAFCGPLSKVPPHLKSGNIVIEQSGKTFFVVFIQNPEDEHDEKIIGTFVSYKKANEYVAFLEKWRSKFLHTWIHHQNHNKHHWEYWIPRTVHFQTDPSMKAGGPVPIPERYVRELLGDWMGANRAYSGSWNIEEWLTKNVNKVKLHENTLDYLKTVLTTMFGPAWVDGVFNHANVGWDDLFKQHCAEFMNDPVAWIEDRFNYSEGNEKPVVLQFVPPDADAANKPWTRLLVRVNDPGALSSLNGQRIYLKSVFKNAGPGKVNIFYRIAETDQQDAPESAPIKPAKELMEGHTNDEQRTSGNGEDRSGDKPSDVPVESLPGTVENVPDGTSNGIGGDSEDGDQHDNSCEVGESENSGDSDVGEGDATDPDVDGEDGDEGGDDDADDEEPPNPPSRRAGNIPSR